MEKYWFILREEKLIKETTIPNSESPENANIACVLFKKLIEQLLIHSLKICKEYLKRFNCHLDDSNILIVLLIESDSFP